MKEYITTAEAARYLRIAKRTVYYLIETGQIKPIQNKKNGRIRFTIASLDAYADPSTTK